MKPKPEQWFANSKHLVISYEGDVLGFVLADTLLRELIQEFAPPSDNPIIQELLHDFKKEPFFRSKVITQEHEVECLEYIKAHSEWQHVNWHFQECDLEARGIVKLLYGSNHLEFVFGDEEVPSTLFKYTKIEYAADYIVNSSIYLSSPKQFNDPFDCPFKKEWREKAHNIGISCFSRKNDNTLMFSHYADAHRGMCLVFDPSWFSDLTNRWGENVGGRIQRVCYYGRHPEFDERTQPAKIATAKHFDWSYESEYRLTTNYAYPSGVYKFNPAALMGVIFGIRTPDQEKEDIYRLSIEAGRDIAFYQAREISDRLVLDICPVEFDQRELMWSRK